MDNSRALGNEIGETDARAAIRRAKINRHIQRIEAPKVRLVLTPSNARYAQRLHRRSRDRVLLTVSEPGKPEAIVSCYHQCSFLGVLGSYTLRATSPEGKVRYETTLSVGQRNEFNVSLGRPGARTAGLIAGIVGPLAMAGGFLLGVGHVVDERGCGEPNCPTTTDYVPRGDASLSGLVTTIVGWTVYAATGPRVDEANEGRAPSHDPRPQVGILALPRGGWGVGLSTLFCGQAEAQDAGRVAELFFSGAYTRP